MPKAIRITAIVFLALAALLVVLAFSMGRRAPEPSAQVNNSGAANAAAPAKVTRVVAAKRLPAGQPISALDLKTAQVDANSAAGFNAPSEVAGLIPLHDIEADQAIAQSSLQQGIATRLRNRIAELLGVL